MRFGLLMGLFLATSVSAHEMTPTYFEFKSYPYADTISTTQIKLFNRREDVNYYEISVFDSEWNPIPFAATNKIVKIEYLNKKTIDIFVRNQDLPGLTYICTLSKLEKDVITSGAISSRICSKMKEK